MSNSGQWYEGWNDHMNPRNVSKKVGAEWKIELFIVINKWKLRDSAYENAQKFVKFSQYFHI